MVIALAAVALAGDPWQAEAPPGRVDAGLRLYRSGVAITGAGLGVAGIGFGTAVFAGAADVGVLPVARFVGELAMFGGAFTALYVGLPCAVAGAGKVRRGLVEQGLLGPGVAVPLAVATVSTGGLLLLGGLSGGSAALGITGLGLMAASGVVAATEMRGLAPWTDGRTVGVAARW